MFKHYSVSLVQFITITTCIWFTNHSFAHSVDPFPVALADTKSIVVGTYTDVRYGRAKAKGKNGKKPISKYLFEDVTIYKRNSTQSRNRFVTIVRNNGVDIHDDNVNVIVEPDTDVYSDTSGADLDGIQNAEFYIGSSEETIAALSDSDIEHSLKHTSDFLGFEKGNKYILLIKKGKSKRNTPFFSSIFLVNEDMTISNPVDGTPLIDIVNGNIPIWGYKLSDGVDLLENTGGDVVFEEDNSYLPGISESEFIRKIRDKIGVKKGSKK